MAGVDHIMGRGRYIAATRCLVAGWLAAIACTPRSSPQVALTPSHSTLPAACELLAPPAIAPESLWVAVTDAVFAADAPVPRTRGEHLVFPLLYAPGARNTCDDQKTLPLPTGDWRTSDARPRADSATPAQPKSDSTWPQGVGLYVVQADLDTALRLGPRPGAHSPPVRVSRIAARAGRDAIDAGVDVLLTADPTTVAYAETQATIASIALPWDRVYAFIPAEQMNATTAESSRVLRNELATDAVREEARAVDDPPWWQSAMSCPQSAVRAPRGAGLSGVRAGRIVYDRDDGVARALSERLVALVNERSSRVGALFPATAGATVVRAEGLDDSAFSASVVAGGELGYVVGLPRRAPSTCEDVPNSFPTSVWPHAIALIETRSRVLVRRGRVGLMVDGLGDLYLEPAERSLPASAR
jgi:hypothetical protein